MVRPGYHGTSVVESDDRAREPRRHMAQDVDVLRDRHAPDDVTGAVHDSDRVDAVRGEALDPEERHVATIPRLALVDGEVQRGTRRRGEGHALRAHLAAEVPDVGSRADAEAMSVGGVELVERAPVAGGEKLHRADAE